MYTEIAKDHVLRPRNVGPLEDATHCGVAGIPGEGPFVQIWLRVADGRILRAAYATYNCMAAIACASMAAEIATGPAVERIKEMNARDLVLLLGGLPAGKEHCAEMTVAALQRALGAIP